MEWVEITARSVEEAKELALDQLGIDEQDVELEVLEEPRAGLFGRLRGQARVRARVRPTAPRPKVDRRERRRRGAKSDDAPGVPTTPSPEPAAAPVAVSDRPEETEPAPSPNGRRTRQRQERSDDVSELTIDEQAQVVATFLTGLAEAFGTTGSSTTVERVDDDTVEVRIDGGELGLLIGPKGQTLQTVQELARTVVQRRGGGTQEGRIRIDIAGYRQRRREALERFTRQVAESVLATGTQKALEPMNAADRKVVHDTANGIDGVKTISQGEEPRRRVVLLPDNAG
jgi:spoIIIJ-associated protein